MDSHSFHPRFHKGFTLVELLVSVVIVLLLGTVATFALRSAGERSKEARCMSNLRSIGAAMHLYAGDHGGRFPETTHSASIDRAWVAALEPYLGNYDEARVCPADPRKAERLAAGGTSYVLNSFLFVPETDAFGQPVGVAWNRPASIQEPARTLLAFVCSDRMAPGPGNDHTHSHLWSTWRAVCADIAPDRFGAGGARGRSNYLYACGRVESIPAVKMKQQTEAGHNIALPPGFR